jgi:hypothetical protein
VERFASTIAEAASRQGSLGVMNDKMRHLGSRSLSALLVGMLLLAGCGKPAYPPPSGYVDACYGGEGNDEHKKVHTEFVMRIQATEQEWPALTARLKDFGATQKLAVFDTSMKLDWVHMVEVSLCSPAGLFVWADNRLYSDPMPNQDPNHVLVLVSHYSDAYDWRPIAEGLAAAFKDWPEPVATKYGNIPP